MKLLNITALLAATTGLTLAHPTRRDTADFTHEVPFSATKPSTQQPAFPIHESCNVTLHQQLSRALDETVVLARHAKEHLLRWGGESPFVQRYFGNASTAAPIGFFERVASAERGSMLFRCDDPDKNCATQEGMYQVQDPLYFTSSSFTNFFIAPKAGQATGVATTQPKKQ
jgi:hypothetical protein